MIKKWTKRAMALLCATTALGGTLGAAACGGNQAAEGENVLEVFCWDAGYGTEWCSTLLDMFKEESWVKEKYPNLQIKYTADGNMNIATTKIDAGERANTVDLFFTAGIDKYLGKDASGYEFFADMTEGVYNQKVPGEEVTVKDKMLPTYVDSMRFYEKGQDSNTPNVPFKSYVFPWASGMDGILYNADHLAALNMEVPLTTNQFMEACETISKGKSFDYNNRENGDYAILRDAGGAYWEYLYPIWWGQYEGITEYRNFFNGVYNGAVSADVHRQRGKLHALTAMEKILDWDNGYVYKKNSGLDYMQAQTQFLKGDGVFYANGDWFSKEMASTAAEVKQEYSIEYEIRMMRTPIVSEIIEKTPSIPNESTLRSVIRCVDAGYPSIAAVRLDPTCTEMSAVQNVTEEDYDIIKNARGIIHAIGPNHQAGVPSYAQGKEIAFDFLRYMATDKAQEVYIEKTGGASLPFDYDVKKKNNALYQKLFEGEGKGVFQVEKDRLSYLYEQCYETEVLPDPDSFPLVKWGNMAAIYSLGGHSTVAYFANKGATGTAREVWEADIAYYIDGGAFNTCLDKAGLR